MGNKKALGSPRVNEKAEARTRRLDLAARAAWLYYIKRRTQDEIAADLSVSRPNAQRLVALAISEGLIKFRLDHPLLKSMELGERIRDRYGLDLCEVAPTVDGQSDRAGVALLAAQYIENLLSAPTPQILALGTGRTLLETVREVSSMERPDHRIVSAVGNLTRNGRASPYDVAMRLADRVGAQCYPLPLPVLTDTREECEFLRAQRGYAIVDSLFRQADAVVLGVGSIGSTAPLLIDGFVTPEELAELLEAGAVGELRSHPFDHRGVADRQFRDGPADCRSPALRAETSDGSRGGRAAEGRSPRGGPRGQLRQWARHRRADRLALARTAGLMCSALKNTLDSRAAASEHLLSH